MKYELVLFEQWIRHPNAANADQVQTEVQRIKNAIHGHVHGHVADKVVKRYIHSHQQMIISFLKELPPDNYDQPNDILRDAVDELLIFLQDHYSPFISWDFTIPRTQTRQLINYLKGNISRIEQGLPAIGTDPALIKILLATLQDFVQSGESTFRRHLFIEALAKGLLEIISNLPAVAPNTSATEQRFTDLLCFINFNDLDYYRYIKEKIRDRVASNEGIPEQIYSLSRLQKYFSRLPRKPGYGYVADRMDIASMVADWCSDQLKLKEAGTHDASPPAPPLETTATAEEHKDIESRKVLTTLTIPELGLMLRLFIEAGVFRTRNWRGLARFMGKYVVTINKGEDEEASVDYVYNTMHSTTEPVARTVHAILNRMQTKLNRITSELKEKQRDR